VYWRTIVAGIFPLPPPASHPNCAILCALLRNIPLMRARKFKRAVTLNLERDSFATAAMTLGNWAFSMAFALFL